MSQDVGIEVNRASVHTLSLSVQVMKLDKRQVTLAVFRQLDNLDLVDRETGAFAGTPWGRVNYHLPECITGQHLHIVWQKGDRLFRANVTKEWPLYSQAPYDVKELDEICADNALELWALSDAPLDLPCNTRQEFVAAAEAAVLKFPQENAWTIPLQGAMKRNRLLSADNFWDSLYGRYQEQMRERESAKKYLSSGEALSATSREYYERNLAKPIPDPIRMRAERLVKLREGLNADALAGQMEEDLAKLQRLRRLAAVGPGLWSAAYAKLAAMDQLFIAT